MKYSHRYLFCLFVFCLVVYNALQVFLKRFVDRIFFWVETPAKKTWSQP